MKTLPLHYQRFGAVNKKSLVLLHGFLGSSQDWLPHIQFFKNEFDILAIDLPGHGQSKDITSPYSFNDVADGIITILDRERISTGAFLGYSMGGRVALFTAIRFPHRFSRLILESSSPGVQSNEEKTNRLKFEHQVIEKLKRLSMPDFIHDWYSMTLFDSIRTHPHYDKMVAQRVQNDSAGLIASIKNLGSSSMPSLWSELPQLDCPIHFIFGDLDEKYKSIAKGIQKHGNSVSLYEIKNSGHNTHFENPQEFCTVVKNILKE